MMSKTPLLVLALGCVAFTGCATSEIDKPETNAGETMHFKNLDKSGDGILTLDELPPNLKLALDFPAYDLNKDGVISEYEFGEYVEGINEDD